MAIGDILIARSKVISYLRKCLGSFKLAEFEDLLSEYFEIEYSEIEDGILKRKMQIKKQNIMELIILRLENDKWSNLDILNAAFNIELDYTSKYHRKYGWTAHKFLDNSNKEEISDLGSDLRRAIRNEKKDALVLVKQVHNLFWISVVIKDLKNVGLYKKPFYIALADNGKYFFTRRAATDNILQILAMTLGYEKFKQVKLDGGDIKSLLKLLVRNENVDLNNRPTYQGGEAIVNSYGVDMTQKKNFEDFYMKCVDNDDDINIEHYKITAINCPWLGDDSPNLRDVVFNSSITLSGNVARIIKQLPIASMLRPPFPDFYVNFSVEGKNRILKKNKSMSQQLSQ